MDRVLGFVSETEELLKYMSYLLILMGILVFLILQFVNVPYGRFASSSFGFPVNAKLAWFIQEVPSLVVPVYQVFYTVNNRLSHLPNQILVTMFICHYMHRSLIFPFLIRGGKPIPFIIFALAFIFCFCNGYLQARYLTHYAVYPSDWITKPCFLLGCITWLIGMLLNIHSDHILRTLRKPGERDYKIPRGGMFEYVSGANFFGEVLEWTGFAVAGWSTESAAFAVFTFLTLCSRAKQHHRWYLEKFEDYPKSRKAIIPFVY
ncbi:3-oxo-5-alpha-steroid 4-dehydrogenase 1 isoform X1 [Latimeria chalumnae]|uniref:3-oxo-5-alpha-steroid 4-dehydrogenase n=2 Tax=Latimeria TaxID=7896 RepID=M3XJW8_LATCH|nr:PREDICTED: 3-oxo-5-alpha-steroid 4-dehydrogenase 1 isoform X1 [Latimeria chalumnae]CCP19143.1 5 alpha-reductase 1 [Latimeria menadoensis]|eukprot:XP_006012612.1 PREDICTED: 3-oxo-5-alpha-steroid 4-dehydrogenase 1 isoform X1 [Latimeria chalumnae]